MLFILLTLFFVTKTDNELTIAVNKYRTSKDKNPMIEDPNLNKAAQYQADWMADNAKLSHRNPDPNMKTYKDRINKLGFKTKDCSESLAFNSDNSVQVAIEGWKQHFRTEKTMSSKFRYIGGGMKKSKKDDCTYYCITVANKLNEDKDEDKDKGKKKGEGKEQGKGSENLDKKEGGKQLEKSDKKADDKTGKKSGEKKEEKNGLFSAFNIFGGSNAKIDKDANKTKNKSTSDNKKENVKKRDQLKKDDVTTLEDKKVEPEKVEVGESEVKIQFTCPFCKRKIITTISKKKLK